MQGWRCVPTSLAIEQPRRVREITGGLPKKSPTAGLCVDVGCPKGRAHPSKESTMFVCLVLEARHPNDATYRLGLGCLVHPRCPYPSRRIRPAPLKWGALFHLDGRAIRRGSHWLPNPARTKIGHRPSTRPNNDDVSGQGNGRATVDGDHADIRHGRAEDFCRLRGGRPHRG